MVTAYNGDLAEGLISRGSKVPKLTVWVEDGGNLHLDTSLSERILYEHSRWEGKMLASAAETC
jgi:hypothetical protein